MSDTNINLAAAFGGDAARKAQADTKALQDRILDVTNGTKTGAILRCAMGRNGAVIPGPAFTSKAIITSDGFVQANFRGADGRDHHSAFVGGWDEVQDNVSRLTTHMKLSSTEKEQVWQWLKDWVAIDYR